MQSLQIKGSSKGKQKESVPVSSVYSQSRESRESLERLDTPQTTVPELFHFLTDSLPVRKRKEAPVDPNLTQNRLSTLRLRGRNTSQTPEPSSSRGVGARARSVRSNSSQPRASSTSTSREQTPDYNSEFPSFSTNPLFSSSSSLTELNSRQNTPFCSPSMGYDWPPGIPRKEAPDTPSRPCETTTRLGTPISLTSERNKTNALQKTKQSEAGGQRDPEKESLPQGHKNYIVLETAKMSSNMMDVMQAKLLNVSKQTGTTPRQTRSSISSWR